MEFKIQGQTSLDLEPLHGTLTPEGSMTATLSASSTTLPYYETSNDYGTTVYIGDETIKRDIERRNLRNGV